jgi:Fe-S cluster assembly protein SufD
MVRKNSSSPDKTTVAEATLAQIFTDRQVGGSTEIAALRSAAFDVFSAKGLPSRRDEAWKYTDLRSLMQDVKPLATPPDANERERARESWLLNNTEVRRIVFVGGFFAPELSDLQAIENGLDIRSLSEALANGDPVAASYLGKAYPTDDPAFALNTAFMGDGVVIHIEPGTHVERPLQFVFLVGAAVPATIFLRSLVVVEKGARVTLVETFEGPDQCDYHVNAATEIFVADDAQIERIKISREGSEAMHVSTVTASIGQNARLNDFGLNIGGALLRNQFFVHLKGQGSFVGLRGANILCEREHADTTLLLDHSAERTESKALYKSVLDNDSRAVFQGKIQVRPRAQKTDARMMARALLLSETAQANCKPELEIFADDVQCAHGATVGALDEDLKFYLMARGIPEMEAVGLLIEAFIGEVLDALEHDGVRDSISGIVAARLRGRQ